MNTNTNCPTLTALQERRAPWNSSDQTERKFDITVKQVLIKYTTVPTDKYISYYNEIDQEECFDTSEVDWNAAYKDRHMTVPELLEVLKHYIRTDLTTEGGMFPKRYLKYLLSECEGWTEDELKVIED